MKSFFEEELVVRVPDEVVERLKREVDLVALVERSGVELVKAGGDLVGRCPFHDDKTPSLMVSGSKGLWHCMGACQAGGSVVDWVMAAQGVSFRHAVEVLRAGVAPQIVAGRRGPVAAVSTTRKLPSPLDVLAEDQVLLSQVADFYHHTLLDSPEALGYLARRKIDNLDVVGRFRLGFANRTLGYRLPAANRKTGALVRGRLQGLGVLRGSGHEHLVGSVTVPIIGGDGVICGFYGRKVRGDLRTGTPVHLYLPGPHRGVWNEDSLGAEVVLCESLVDALSFYSAGFTSVTASYGTGGFTSDHRAAFEARGVRRVLLAYDHDPAGDQAADKLATELLGQGVECLRVVFPYGADANQVAVEADDPQQTLSRLVKQARWMGTGTTTRRQGDIDSGQSDVAGGQGDTGFGEGDIEIVGGDVGPGGGDVAGVELVGEGDMAGEPQLSSSAAGVLAVQTPGVPAVPVAHDELLLDCGTRRWRVRHIPKVLSVGSLRVNVMVSAGDRFHIDTVDLYVAKQRSGFTDAVAAELRCDRETVKAELGRVLLAVEDAQAAAAAPEVSDPVSQMTSSEREAALELLGSSDLLGRVAEGFLTLGVVGEQTAALTAWLALTSRLSDRPLGVVVQSSSSAGKSTLADAALSLIPAEAKVAYSAMTGQALYYLGETDLAHKVLSVAEEEGASRASYALKLLVSEGRLSIAAAGKDPTSGRLVTNTYEVEGPVALLMTTTAAELEEELANRLLVLAVDEGRSQTRAVHRAQRHGETLDGLVARSERAHLVALHQNAQRLLSPVAVVNPHAPNLNFSDRATRARRDNAKYLGLIRAVALAHQHQRKKKHVTVSGRTVSYIEATQSDVAAVEKLCASVLDVTCDELSPVTRRLLDAVGSFVSGRHDPIFTRRELREATGFGDTQLKVHLSRLVDLEYVTVERAGPQTSYQLAEHLQPHQLEQHTDRSVSDGDRSGQMSDRSGIGRFSGHSDIGASPQADGDVSDEEVLSAGIGRVGSNGGKLSSSRRNVSSKSDRPGLRSVRGTGDNDQVVVARI